MKLVDLGLRVTKATYKASEENEKKVDFGHVGTHFDVMNKEFF